MTTNTCRALALLAVLWCATAFPQDIVFDDPTEPWTQEGIPRAGNWIVAPSGTSVDQTLNWGIPTLFVSPNNITETTVEGTFSVASDFDDDYLGFVAGYNGPLASEGDDPTDYDFVLFDWKQGTQPYQGYEAREGFTLSRVQGTISQTDTPKYFWGHTENPSNPKLEVLATDLGDTRGWEDYTKYDFRLTYTATRLKAEIWGGTGDFENGQTIFDVTGSFPSGRFGFYNFSQASANYHGLTKDQYADAEVMPKVIDFGDLHVGDTAQQALTITNDAPAGWQALNSSFGAVDPGLTDNGGSVVELPAGASDNTSMALTLNATGTATVGPKTLEAKVENESVSFAKTTPLPTETVTVTAVVYRLADPTVNTPSPIDLGIVHVGDLPEKDLSISNTAPDDGYSERLNANFGATDPAVTTNGGSISQLGPGDTDVGTMKVGVDTTTAGLASGDVVIEFESDGDGINTLGQTPLPDATLTVTAQVNDYADPDIWKKSGDGTLWWSDPLHGTLDLGTAVEGEAACQMQLELGNSELPPPGYQDWLGGSWEVNAPDFSATGFTTFSMLQPGDSIDGMWVKLETDVLGTFSGQITLHPQSGNDDGSSPLPDIVINLQGKVREPPIPEPSGVALLGLLGLALRRRRT